MSSYFIRLDTAHDGQLYWNGNGFVPVDLLLKRADWITSEKDAITNFRMAAREANNIPLPDWWRLELVECTPDGDEWLMKSVEWEAQS